MIWAIIQARMSSTRLPGKVLREINGRPMLSYMLERVSASKKIDKVALITSIDSSDDPIAEFCRKKNIFCFRGSLEDVLDRYYQAACRFKADIIVRLTSDCPLIDPRLIDEVISIYKKENYDYVATTLPPIGTFPDGMDVEVFSFTKLKQVWSQAKRPSEREHMTFYFWKNPELFSIFRYDLPEDLSKYRLTVDYPEDFEVIKAILISLYANNPLFTLNEIIDFLRRRPNIYKINAHIKSNEGWQSAYEKDKEAGFIK